MSLTSSQKKKPKSSYLLSATADIEDIKKRLHRRTSRVAPNNIPLSTNYNSTEVVPVDNATYGRSSNTEYEPNAVVPVDKNGKPHKKSNSSIIHDYTLNRNPKPNAIAPETRSIKTALGFKNYKTRNYGGKKSRKRRNKKSKSNNRKRKSKSNKTFRYF